MSDLGNAAISDSGDDAMLASVVEKCPVDPRKAGDAVLQYRTMPLFAIALEGVAGLILLSPWRSSRSSGPGIRLGSPRPILPSDTSCSSRRQSSPLSWAASSAFEDACGRSPSPSPSMALQPARSAGRCHSKPRRVADSPRKDGHGWTFTASGTKSGLRDVTLPSEGLEQCATWGSPPASLDPKPSGPRRHGSAAADPSAPP